MSLNNSVWRLPFVQTRYGYMVVMDIEHDSMYLAYPTPIRSDKINYPVEIGCTVMLSEGYPKYFTTVIDWESVDPGDYQKAARELKAFTSLLKNDIGPAIDLWITNNKKMVHAEAMFDYRRIVLNLVKDEYAQASPRDKDFGACRIAEKLSQGEIDINFVLDMMAFFDPSV